MKKTLQKILALGMLGAVAFSAFGCGPEVIEDINKDETQLYVANYNGGIGHQWVVDAAARFETTYANKSFEDGKTGVQVMLDPSKNYTGQGLTDMIPSSKNEVFIVQSLPYFEMAGNGLMDITDVVTQTKNEQDGKTIYEKLLDSDKEDLKVNGKYYAIPNSEYTYGLTYDAGLFTNKKFYFSATLDEEDEVYPGTNAFISSNSDKKSCGPDGKFDTYDDGLPSTVQEFYKLIDRMDRDNVTPFVFTGGSKHYTTQLLISFYQNLAGANEVQANFNYDTNGEAIDVVTHFESGEPVTEPVVITKDNANKLKSSLAWYQAAEVCQKVFSDAKYYQKGCDSTTFSNLDAMEKFYKSGLDGEEYIGMLIDGSYWYNEADMDDLQERVKRLYPKTYTQKDMKFMPLPRQYEGTVTPSEQVSSAPVILDVGGVYVCINANTPKNHIEVAKTFVSFIYGDEELKEATRVSNGIARGVQYDLSSLKDINSFAASVNQMRDQAQENGSVLKCMSGNDLFKRNQKYFTINTGSEYFHSTTGGKTYYNVFEAFSKGVSAQNYFEGLAITDAQWKSY